MRYLYTYNLIHFKKKLNHDVLSIFTFKGTCTFQQFDLNKLWLFLSLQDLVMDILRVLSAPDLEVRKKTLTLALDLVTSRNIEEVGLYTRWIMIFFSKIFRAYFNFNDSFLKIQEILIFFFNLLGWIILFCNATWTLNIFFDQKQIKNPMLQNITKKNEFEEL